MLSASKSRRFDIGLARLMKRARRGVPMRLDEIARECGVSPDTVSSVEKKALRKIRRNDSLLCKLVN